MTTETTKNKLNDVSCKNKHYKSVCGFSVVSLLKDLLKAELFKIEMNFDYPCCFHTCP